jgi:Pentapeptide repeats (8 copies)
MPHKITLNYRLVWICTRDEYGPIDLHDRGLPLADLHEADLQRANLERAGLREANLQEAILRGADLSTAHGLNKEQLEQAVTDEDTLLPKSIQ